MAPFYIYVRIQKHYNEYYVVKVGGTCDYVRRNKNYLTGEYIDGYYVLVFEFLESNITFYTLEKFIKNYFKCYWMKREMFKDKIIDEIENYLSLMNLTFRKLTIDEMKSNVPIVSSKKYMEECVTRENVNEKNAHVARIKFLLNKIVPNHIKIRNNCQKLYVTETIDILKKDFKATIVAPTGFGKTVMIYDIIAKMNLKKILFITPRRDLNIQSAKKSPIEPFHYSHNSNKNFINTDELFVTCCYQSIESIYENLVSREIKFDIIIFDECHTFTKYSDHGIMNDTDITTFRLFCTATPVKQMDKNVYGEIIEKVKIWQLINDGICCHIETIIKHVETMTEHNLRLLITESMIKYNKRKGIIYFNDSEKAKSLYFEMKKQKDIKTFIYISRDYDDIPIEDTDINTFNECSEKCVVISINKLTFGYDNSDIDFICFGDIRSSDCDIRQIIGRGLRWIRETYPDKILHVLIPLLRTEISNFKSLTKYLDFIIGECRYDFIFKSDSYAYIGNGKTFGYGEIDFSKGESVPFEIIREYSTTRENMFSKFMRMLKRNKIYDEISYNEFRKIMPELYDLKDIKQKYPNFCFRDIHPMKNSWYWNREEAEEAYKNSIKSINKKYGCNKVKRLTTDKILIIMNNDIDKRIPNIDFDYYY